MKNTKKYIFIVLAICLTILIGGVIFFLKRTSASGENAVTRREWIEMLTEQMGIQEYTTETSDFDGEDFATGQFIALTAMKAIGESKFRISFGMEEDVTDDTYMEFALEHGLVEKDKLEKGFTREECEQVLETLKDLYFSEFWKDDYSNIVYRDGVMELSTEDVLRSNIDGSEIAVTDNMINSCKAGSVIVFTQENTGLKLARKITGMDADGILTLDEVELGEVVETLTVSDITEMTFDDIVNYYGLHENIGVSSDYMAQQHDARVIDAGVFSGEVNSKGYKLSVSTQGDGEKRCIAIKITENATGVSYTLPISDKVKREDDYAAEINIDKINIGGQVDFSFKDGLKYAEAAVDAHATFKSEIKVKEERKEKKFLLFKTPVPLGNGLIGADLEIYLVLSISGSISFEAQLPLEASVSYEAKKGIRNFKHHTAFEDPMIEINCAGGVGLRLEPVLIVLGCPNVMDMELDFGASAGVKITTQPNSQICADVSISFPVIKVSACKDDEKDTIIGDLGFSGEWEIITSDNAPIKKGLHYELGPGERAEFVRECTYEKPKGNVSGRVRRPPSLPDETSGPTRISGYEGAMDLWINAPFEDAGEYYIIKGNLQAPYCILKRDFNTLHPGDRFTIRDKEFVMGDRLETEDFPGGIYTVNCVSDGSTYYIQTEVVSVYGGMDGDCYPICRLIPDYDAITESMEILSSDLNVQEIKIAKDTYITTLIEMSHYTDHLIAVDVSGKSEEEILALEEENRQRALAEIAYTAEDCFENHILFDDWLDIANFSSAYGELEYPIRCYAVLDENGEIDIIVWDSFG